MSWGAQSRSKDAKTRSAAGGRSEKPEAGLWPMANPAIPMQDAGLVLAHHYLPFASVGFVPRTPAARAARAASHVLSHSHSGPQGAGEAARCICTAVCGSLWPASQFPTPVLRLGVSI
jgi:hypothetical protein